MLNFTNSIVFILSNLVITVFFILLGGVIPLIERRVLSLTHRRVGPKFVGFKGKLQFIADALKLLIKEFFLPKNTNRFFFFTTAIFVLNLNLFLLFNFIWLFNISVNQSEYSILLIPIVEIFNSIILFFIGFFVKNKYTLLSSSRIINSTFVLEILTSFFLILVYITSRSFFFGFYTSINSNQLSLFNFFLIFFFLIFFFLILLKKTPFDFIEAETEIIMGVHTEHSGFLAGSIILVEYVHLFF